MNAANSSVIESTVASAGKVEELSALFVLNSLNVGGSETKIVRLVDGLLHRGMRAGIAYLNEPNGQLKLLKPDIPTWDLERSGKFSILAVKRLRTLIQQQQPACVLSVNLYPALYVALATAAMRARPRTLALLNTTALPDEQQWRRTFYRPFLRRMDMIVYGCGLQRSEWSPHLGGDHSHSRVIYNGVDMEHFAPLSPSDAFAAKERFGIPPQAFVIGTIGRLEQEKNQKVLLEATAELRRRSIDAHLLLVGEGRRRKELEGRASELQLAAHVTFAGVHADVRPLLSVMDVFVLPSTHVETFSNAALEAMAMSRPVVLSRVGGASEMIGDGIEGYTIAPGALSSDLPLLLQRLHEDPSLRQRLGEAARERVGRCFSSRSMLESYAILIANRSSDQLKV